MLDPDSGATVKKIFRPDVDTSATSRRNNKTLSGPNCGREHIQKGFVEVFPGAPDQCLPTVRQAFRGQHFIARSAPFPEADPPGGGEPHQPGLLIRAGASALSKHSGVSVTVRSTGSFYV
jgi:hypothetical protein